MKDTVTCILWGIAGHSGRDVMKPKVQRMYQMEKFRWYGAPLELKAAKSELPEPMKLRRFDADEI